MVFFRALHHERGRLACVGQGTGNSASSEECSLTHPNECGGHSPLLEKHIGRAPQSGAPILALDWVLVRREERVGLIGDGRQGFVCELRGISDDLKAVESI